MKTSSAKQKGRKLQQWVRDRIMLFTGLTGVDVRSTSMGAQGTDIQLSVVGLDLMPLSIECKSHAKIAVYKFFEQARKEADSAMLTVKTGKIIQPCVIVKQNKCTPLAVVDADHYLYLVARNNRDK